MVHSVLAHSTVEFLNLIGQKGLFLTARSARQANHNSKSMHDYNLSNKIIPKVEHNLSMNKKLNGNVLVEESRFTNQCFWLLNVEILSLVTNVIQISGLIDPKLCICVFIKV